MRLKVISDGTPYGTHIVNAETGENVTNITGIRWSMQAGELAQATFDLDYVEAELEGDVEDEG
jgi:hypothetical protein